MVSYTAAGDDPGVAELDRVAQPPHPAGGQRIHGDDQRGVYLRCQTAHRLSGLHAGSAQYAGSQHRHRAEAGKLPGHGGDQMPGDENAVRRQRANGVRRHGGISQPCHQYGAAFRNQLPELLPHCPDGPIKKALTPLPEGGKIQRAVAAHRLSQGRFAPAIQNVDAGNGISLHLFFHGFDAGQLCGGSGGFLPQFAGFQSQICAFCKQSAHPPYTKSCGNGVSFCGDIHNMQKIIEKTKKGLLF